MRKKTVFKRLMAATLALVMGLSLVPGSAEAIAKPKLSRTSLVMKAKTKTTLKVKGSKIRKVTWKSSKTKIVAVNKKNSKTATLTAKKKGVALVSAVVKYGNRKTTLKCKVTVKNNTAADTATATAAPTTPTTPMSTQTVVATPVPSPSPAVSSGPTQIPVLNENNLAVAEYPTLFSDVPDCDYIRVGGAYYMVSTTMNLCPGAPIMKSTDLVHWQIVNYVYDTLQDDDANNLENGKQVYGNGSWAAAIRYNEADGKYYVIFNSNGYGFYVWTTEDIENGSWQGYFIKTSFHDPALIFDNEKMYVIYGGSNLQELELEEPEYEGDLGEVKKVGNAKELFKKDESKWGLWEGVHAYKIGEYYYLMIIASPVSGWFRTETCYRSKKLADSEPTDWEEQIIFQGSTYEYGTGIAQGAIVDTIYGDWYGILFQDHDAIGRIPSILAVNWNYTDSKGNNYKDWPMMGYYDDNNKFVSCQSVKDKVTKPLTVRLNKSEEPTYIVGDDDFTYAEGDKLKLAWQWNHNPDNDNWSLTANPGHYRITNGRTCNNIWFARNSLTQRTVGPEFTSESAILTSGMKAGDYAGMVAVGSAYGMVGVKCDDNGDRYVFMGSGTPDTAGKKADVNAKITENAVKDKVEGDSPVYLKIEYSFKTADKKGGDTANFFYSLDGQNWIKIGKEVGLSFDTGTTFMGTRTWLSSYATKEAGGYVDFDYYKQY